MESVRADEDDITKREAIVTLSDFKSKWWKWKQSKYRRIWKPEILEARYPASMSPQNSRSIVRNIRENFPELKAKESKVQNFAQCKGKKFRRITINGRSKLPQIFAEV